MRLSLFLLAVLSAPAAAQEPQLGQPIASDPPVAEQAPEPPAEKEETSSRMRLSDRLDYQVDPDAYSIVTTVKGLSTHRPMFLYPITFSPEYSGDETEVVFQFSAKQRVFGTNLYVAYTQKSFAQLYNSDESKPFRDSNYNPELFYRWILDPETFNHWNIDFGYEHESNGQPIPFSRSWDRVYVAPFQARGKHLAYFKFWYRIPEDGEPSSETHPGGDDNPDILDFMGYGELSFSRQIGNKQLLTAMVRGNPGTGRGAVHFTWSMPTEEQYAFYSVAVFHGYGESLSDYNNSVTRVLIGLMLSR